MDLNKGQPGMGGNVVQAENTRPRFGSKALTVLNNLLGQAQRKEFMDYQHSLNLDRDTHREAAKTTGHIFRGRADLEHMKEGVDFVRTNPNDPDGPKGPAPQSFRFGQASYDTGSSYAKDMQDLIKMKQDTLKQQQEQKEKDKQTKKTNTPGGKGGGKTKNKVSEPKERPGTLKDTTAAYKAGHIDAEQAAEISPTFAKNLGKKAAVQEVKGTPVKPKQTKKTPNKVKKTPNNSGGVATVKGGFQGSNVYKDSKADAFDINKRANLNPNKGKGSKPPKPPKPPKAGM